MSNIEKFQFTQPNCATKGKYPKSFIKSDLIKITHDRLLELSGNCNEVNKIIYYYDLILTFQSEIEKNKLSEYFTQQLKLFKTINNLIGFYFNNIRTIMIKLNIRDDLVIQNDHLHRTHLKTILFYARYHKILKIDLKK